jgi:hypothetical protein
LLGHHADDFIETLLLNLFFAGALKAMPAGVSDNGARGDSAPVYVGEKRPRTPKNASCRSSAAAARPVATWACSASEPSAC